MDQLGDRPALGVTVWESQLKPPSSLLLTGDLAENWRKWKQRFQLFMTASGAIEKDEHVQVAILLHTIGEDALDLFNTFTFTNGDEKKVDQILGAFETHCNPPTNVVFERYEFWSHPRAEGIPVDKYVAELRRKSKSCEFGASESDMIRDKLLFSLNNASLIVMLLRERDLNLEKAVTLCRVAEAVRSQMQAVQTTQAVEPSLSSRSQEDVCLTAAQPLKVTQQHTGQCVHSRLQVKMNSPDSAMDVSVKRVAAEISITLEADDVSVKQEAEDISVKQEPEDISVKQEPEDDSYLMPNREPKPDAVPVPHPKPFPVSQSASETESELTDDDETEEGNIPTDLGKGIVFPDYLSPTARRLYAWSRRYCFESEYYSQPSQSAPSRPDSDEKVPTGPLAYVEDEEEWNPMRQDPDERGHGTDEEPTEGQSSQPSKNLKRPCPKGPDSDEELMEGQSSEPSKKRGKRTSTTAPTLHPEQRWYRMDEVPWHPKGITFTAFPGPRNAAATLQSDKPVDFLELILDEELLQHIVDQTNLYALHNSSRIDAWKPVDIPELKTFLGLVFLTGLIVKPDMESYWSTASEAMETPYFGKTMSRSRFQIIMRFLHFTDSAAARKENDRFDEVRPVLDRLVKKFRELYRPDQNISIDEGTLSWHGKLSFKVRNPQKTDPYGVNCYCLCDSQTGFCYNFMPCCGDGKSLVDTVCGLLTGLERQGYRLYMDHFYNSVNMCDVLLDLGTHFCGTLRKNRGEPPAVKMATLEPGGIVSYHTDRVLCLAWRNTNIVRMVSTFHRDRREKTLTWREGATGKVLREKPVSVTEHYQSMNGVDRLHRMISYYPVIRKADKWTTKFALYLFQICLHNAFVLYKARNPRGVIKSMHGFQESVVQAWTTSTKDRLSQPAQTVHVPGKQVKHIPVRRLSQPAQTLVPGKHLPVRHEPTQKNPTPSKKCKVCLANKTWKETYFRCNLCLIPLCRGPCFEAYHNTFNYKQ